ncbi:MAG: type 4a pilus biogenesis protein PilO [Candidatus Omnitrophota bacterium]
MDKATLEKNQYLIAGILIVFVFLVFYVMFVFMPLVSRLMKLSAEEKQIMNQLKNAETVFADKNKLTEEVENIKKKISYYEKRLPQEINVPEVLDSLIKMGKDSGVVFISIEPLDVDEIKISEESEDSYLQVPIQLSLKAAYHNLGKFINLIERSGRFMEIDSFQISPDQSEPHQHTVHLKVSSYSLSTRAKSERKPKGAL